jgi:hypothetical protein
MAAVYLLFIQRQWIDAGLRVGVTVALETPRADQAAVPRRMTVRAATLTGAFVPRRSLRGQKTNQRRRYS